MPGLMLVRIAQNLCEYCCELSSRYDQLHTYWTIEFNNMVLDETLNK